MNTTSARYPKAPPFDFVLFGGTGDLSLRKVLPALFRRDADGQLDPATRVVAASLDPLDTGAYRTLVQARLRESIHDIDAKGEVWDRFVKRLHHFCIDATKPGEAPAFTDLLAEAPKRVRVFYLATSPSLYGKISATLKRLGLLHDDCRVILEKPLGHDLESSRAIHDQVASVFTEAQTYRIDHYVGKETVQNLMALRFANALFEPMWNGRHIDHVQLTVAESIGIGERASYYDRYGAMRDMLQNHLLQLVCLLAMEPPAVFDAASVREEKLKVLRALHPIDGTNVGRDVVFGQYGSGAIDGERVAAYQAEEGVPDDSRTDTFFAARLSIDNWRWAGVPFYVRSGKRLAQRASEIVIRFKALPHVIFPEQSHRVVSNQLVLRLQPDESIRLRLMAKTPGPGGIRLRPVDLNLGYAETFKQPIPDAYERLLLDPAKGNQTLFMSRAEVEAAWSWVDPILEAWAQSDDAPKRYAAGTWGPSAAYGLIERDGRSWVDPGEEV